MCNSCLKERKTHFQKFRIDGIKAYSIYDYDEYIQGVIYTFKVCGDYELHKLFLFPFEKEISLFFKGYKIVPIPSFKGDDIKRGFNHVFAIFKRLNLEILDILEKTKDIKQVDVSGEKRKEIYKHLKVNKLELVDSQKILIVDDIVTTGSTLKAAIKLIKEGKPKSIKILVIAKTINIKQNWFC